MNENARIATTTGAAVSLSMTVECDEIVATIQKYLREDVISYKIPEQMENRFEWLSEGDVEVKQALLNHLRSHERELAAESLRVNIPILAEHLEGARGKHTYRAAHVLKVGKHEFEISLTERVQGISLENQNYHQGHSSEPNYPWLWWMLAVGSLLFFLGR